MRLLVGCLFFSLTIAAQADEVVLKSGRSLVGEIIERTATNVTIEIGPGRVTFPLAAVDHVVSGPSALGTYRERARSLDPEDAAGWLALGYWARARGLATQANAAFERVIAIEPSNEQAQSALGHVRVGDRWMTREEGYRAQGLVEFRGEWLTPQERDARLAQMQMEADIERQRIESELREAEARARQAEAEARRAEAEVAAAEPAVVPLWMRGGVSERHAHGRRHGQSEAERQDRHGSPTPQPSPRAQATPAPQPTATLPPPPAGAAIQRPR
jgi:hypothetical protein